MSADEYIQEMHNLACCHAGPQVPFEALMATRRLVEPWLGVLDANAKTSKPRRSGYTLMKHVRHNLAELLQMIGFGDHTVETVSLEICHHCIRIIAT